MLTFVKIQKRVLNTSFEEKELEFPLYVKDIDGSYLSIAKVTLVPYEHDPTSISYLRVVKVGSGTFDSNSIQDSKISVMHGVIGEEFAYLLRDYDRITTKEEYEKYFEQVLNNLKSHEK